MKKEHQKDLSLLYYDFNNSKARLMSKISKKVSEQVIQEEAEADSERVRAVERQVRERLRPETRGCEMCMEVDECIGGMCSLHESRFRALCMAVNCGSAAKPTPAPLGRMLPLQS